MNQYLELFHAQRELIDSHSIALLNARRDEAAAAFARLGVPSQKVERYKYTDVARLFAPNYGLNLLGTPTTPAGRPTGADRCRASSRCLRAHRTP